MFRFGPSVFKVSKSVVSASRVPSRREEVEEEVRRFDTRDLTQRMGGQPGAWMIVDALNRRVSVPVGE